MKKRNREEIQNFTSSLCLPNKIVNNKQTSKLLAEEGHRAFQ